MSLKPFLKHWGPHPKFLSHPILSDHINRIICKIEKRIKASLQYHLYTWQIIMIFVLFLLRSKEALELLYSLSGQEDFVHIVLWSEITNKLYMLFLSFFLTTMTKTQNCVLWTIVLLFQVGMGPIIISETYLNVPYNLPALWNSNLEWDKSTLNKLISKVKLEWY